MELVVVAQASATGGESNLSSKDAATVLVVLGCEIGRKVPGYANVQEMVYGIVQRKGLAYEIVSKGLACGIVQKAKAYEIVRYEPRA